MSDLTEEMAQLMADARRATLELLNLVRAEASLHRSPGYGFRPIIWHLAHIGVFEAYWLLQKVRGERPLDDRYERLFDPIQTPRAESKNLPSRREMEAYLARVREQSLKCLEEVRFETDDPLLRDGYVFQLVLEHERQHQETLTYLLHLLDPATKTRPSNLPSTTNGNLRTRAGDGKSSVPDMVLVAEGTCQIGAHGNGFAYDNERPPQTVWVPSFKIDRRLTTNEEYAQFIAEGGYERREWWSDEGWSWRARENWTGPLDWRPDGAHQWIVRRMFDEVSLPLDHPVTGLSWYEAEAYARFRKQRLPTEAEWEKAASWEDTAKLKHRFAWGSEPPSPARCNFGNLWWETTPVGSFSEGVSFYGCLDMTGNVWEWTSDPFRGFPGYEPFPYPEYSQEWFDDDHRVLKGGSWATSRSVLRTSFRNFFRRHFRIAFAGIRLASEA